MACFRPLQAWVSIDGDTRGKVVFCRLPGRLYVELPLPCGKCLGCRMEYARQWAMRCVHEAEMHDDNCMCTLTYDDAHLPDGGSLQPRDCTLWLKRLRKDFPDRKIRYFLAGEYGSALKRPHYHVLLFGIDFQSELEYNKRDTRPCITELQKTWTHGHVHAAPLTYETAAYVARYCLKKQENKEDYGDLYPEYTRMSRRDGIGASWLVQNAKDTYKDDTVIVGQNKSRPPRYYDKRIIKAQGDDALDAIKRKRLEESYRRQTTQDKLDKKEIICKARLANLKRRYEND